jgi:hypothetical protein
MLDYPNPGALRRVKVRAPAKQPKPNPPKWRTKPASAVSFKANLLTTKSKSEIN